MADKEVRVKIIADTSDIKKELSNLEKSLKDLAKVLDNMDNNNLDKTVKSVKELGDAVEKTTDSTKELDDSLDKIDDGNLDEATESAKKLADVLKDTSDKASKGAKEISDSFDKTNKTIKDFGDNVSKIDNEGFDKLSKDVKELDDNFDKTNKSAKEFKDTIEKVDSEGLDRLNKDVEEIREDIKLTTDDMKEFNRQLEKTQDTGKENTTIFDRLKTLFSNLSGEATTFGDRMSSSFEKSKANIFEMISAFSDMKTATKLSEKNVIDLNTSIEKGEAVVDSLKKKYNGLGEEIKEIEERMEILSKAMEMDRPKEQAEQLERQYKELEQVLERLKKIYKNTENAMKGATSQVEKQKKELEKLSSTTDDTFKGFEKLKKGWKDFGNSINEGDFGGAVNSLKDGLSGLFQMIPKEGKIAIAIFTALAKALKECAETGVSQLQKGFDTLGNVFSKISSVAKSFGQEIKNAFENLTDFELDMSSMIETAVNFEDTMVRAGAICGVFGDDLKPLEELARKLGATTRYSATEVAQAMAEMGQQGFTLEEIMSSVEGVLHLATIGNLDLARSSEIVTNTLNAYGMKASESTRLVDVLAQTSVKSGTNVEQLAQALENCSATAGALGISVEDTATAIGLMGDNFIKSGKAGTSLNTFMANMSKPTKAMTDCLAQYNLEGARQKILNGDLIEGYKEFAKRMEGLTNEQKAQIATTIAGKEGMTGFLAIVNSGVKGIEELEHSIEKANGVAKHLADTFDNTLKGALSNLASGIEERLLQVMDKIKPMVKDVIEVLNNFLDIWNGMSEKNLGSGFANAIAYLEKESREWGKAIEKGLSNIIKSIDDFVNSASFDNLLQVGTNIINGIANGILKAKDNGSLDSAIEGAIRKIATWCSQNLDTIVEVGGEIIDSIVKGIDENSGKISEIIVKVMSMQNDIDNAVNYAKWQVIGENIVGFIATGIGNKVGTFWSAIKGLFSGVTSSGSGEITEEDGQEYYIHQDPNTGEVTLIGKKTGEAYGDGVKEGIDSKKEDVGNSVNQNFKDAKPKTDQTASEIGTGISENIMSKLETMDTDDLKALGDELQNLQNTTSTVAQAIGQSFVDIRNSARTEITGMTNIFRNQFTSMTNIVRNQMVNVANIIKNQAVNMANNIRTEFTNIYNIIKNQMTNVANTIRSEMTNCTNIIKNQATNMTNNLRTSFTSMSNIVKNQMVNMASSIRSEMTNCSNIIKNQTTNMANTFRSSFTNLSNIAKNQMTNVANAIRSEMTNCTNIIKNQATNMTNSFRTNFTNLSNIAKNQTKNVSDAIRSNAVNWANIVSNQSKNARDNLTRQFMSMHSVVKTQMANCLSTVRSYMSQIASATSRTMTMNFKVNKTVTTTNVTKNVTKGLDPISTMDSMNTNIRTINPSTMASSGLIGGDINFNLNGGANGNLALEIPLYIDGREIARATATYSQQELAKLSKRSNRKRGE